MEQKTCQIKNKEKMEQIPNCPACGSICIREKKLLKSSGIKNHYVDIWVCSKKEKQSCLD